MKISDSIGITYVIKMHFIDMWSQLSYGENCILIIVISTLKFFIHLVWDFAVGGF